MLARRRCVRHTVAAFGTVIEQGEGHGMAEYIKFRLTAAKAGVTLALAALIAGIAERAQAAPAPQASASASIGSFLKLTGLSSAISGNFLKLEKKLLKIDTSLQKIDTSLQKIDKTLPGYLKIKTAGNTFLKITDANAKFLKITDANAQFLKIEDANQKYLPASAASSFFQGDGNVVSGALSSLGSSSQQLLSLPGGIIVVSIANTPAGGAILTIHNGTSNTLAGAVDMGDGSVSKALTLKPNADTQLPAVQSPAEIRLQIFPGGTFTSVVSILIGLTPNPATQQPEAVAQAFTGGV
jgi:hypothetical protein